MDLSEELQLIEDSKQDIQSFNKLYDLYFPKIYSYCLNRMANKEASEDVTSEVFIKSVEVIKTFDTKRGTGLGPWLYTIAHNCMLNYIKKNAKFLSLLIEPAGDTGEYHQSEDVLGGAEKEIEITEMQKRIATVLNIINTRYAEVITLKYYAELETSEIAEVMKVKIAQVPVILFRALEAFRKVYKEKYALGEIFYI